MCRPACFVIQKEKGVLSVGIQTDVIQIFPTLYACAPLRPAAPLLSGCSFVVFQAVNLRSTCTYSHYLSLSRRVLRIRQPYADTNTAIRRITQHYFARSNHCVSFFHHVSIHRYPACVLRGRIPQAQPWKVSNLERIGKDWTYCYALRFRATHRIVCISILQRSLT